MNKQTRAAQIRSNSFDADANTIDIVWSTGADVLRSDGYEEYIERLLMGAENVRLDRLNSGAPLLDTHNSDGLSSVIGSVVSGTARIEGGRGVATVKLSKAPGVADTAQKIREGVIKNISVGYWTHSSTRSDGSPPVVTVTDWEPLEVSAVPIPADAGAQIRSLRGSRSARKPMSKEARDYQAGAAMASRLLNQPTQTQSEAHGAAEARKALRSTGTMCSAKPTTLDKAEVERGARAARRLLRRKA